MSDERMTCKHQFWKDRNPPGCMNCGLDELEINELEMKEEVNRRTNMQIDNMRLSVTKPYVV